MTRVLVIALALALAHSSTAQETESATPTPTPTPTPTLSLPPRPTLPPVHKRPLFWVGVVGGTLALGALVYGVVWATTYTPRYAVVRF